MGPLDVVSRLTPQMRAVLDKQTELAAGAFDTGEDFRQMRVNYASERTFWNEGGPAMAASVDDVVPGMAASDAATSSAAGGIPIRLHYPSAAGTTVPAADGSSQASASVLGEAPPCLVFIHGGGFVVGNLDTHDRIMRTLAHNSGAVVVGVDYSLSPEARFPQAVLESVHVIRHLRAHGGDYRIDPTRIAIAGDSGGANIAMASAIMLRDEEDPAPAALLLYYGMFGLLDSASRRLYGGQWDGLAPADLRYYMECYTARPEDLQSPYLDCLSADLSTGIPPCYIAATGLDPLRDDSVALAALLGETGLPHEFEIFDGVLHGFLHHSRMLPEAVTALDNGARFFRDHVTRSLP